MKVTKEEAVKAWTAISKECNKLKKENHLLKRKLILIGNLIEKINSAQWKIAGLIDEGVDCRLDR